MTRWLIKTVSMLLPCITATAQIVTTSLGRVQGAEVGDIISFKGLPYAAPPVGALRWRPPQPAHPWRGTFQATDYGHDCMQKPYAPDAATLRTVPSEDCLVGNIWKPAHHKGKLPILVWIYGGGWTNGGSSAAIYDGTQFARQGILFYSFNYRLGRFGFFAHPALTAESKDGLLGNYGYLDQIAALKWIRQNAAAFGGDPNNITVFGESSGGFGVHMLMTSPLAHGLMTRAMIESAGGRSLVNATSLHEGRNGRPSAEQIGMNFASRVGVRGDDEEVLSKLRNLPSESLIQDLEVATAQSQASTFAGPMIDGNTILSEPSDAYDSGASAAISLMIGANDRDLGFIRGKNTDDVLAIFGSDSPKARELYSVTESTDLATLKQTIGADFQMLEPARFVARTMSRRKQAVWEFRFSYVATSMRPQWAGALHSTAVPFIFDTARVRYGSQVSPDDLRVAQQTNSYVANFVKSGDPNGPGLPAWSRYSASDDLLMNFTLTGPKLMRDPRWRQLDLVEKHTVH